ncbi:MAG: hypothetical protein QNJ64_05075 [Crocosphaera sp.]|nr:hypothetical protein [Crocosphaera sp.]
MIENSEKEGNTELIYSYTEERLKTQSESLNRLDTKSSAFLAFTGILVRFANSSVESTVKGWQCYSCILLEILAYISLGLAALFLCLGLTARFTGTVISPKALMENKWYFAPKSEMSDYIISAWAQAQEEYERIGSYKSKNLNFGVILIAVALICIIFNALISIVWGTN